MSCDETVKALRSIFMLLFITLMITLRVGSPSRATSSSAMTDSTSGAAADTGSRNAVTMNVAVILPFVGNYSWSLPRIKPAITLAVDDVTSTAVTSGPPLPLHFRINYGDSRCSETVGPLAAIDMYFERRADVFIGPACDYAVSPVARFSPHWNIPVVTAVILGLVLDSLVLRSCP